MNIPVGDVRKALEDYDKCKQQPTPEQWAWMAKQKCFLVGASDFSQKGAKRNAHTYDRCGILTGYDDERFLLGNTAWKYATIIRKPNIIQPCFDGVLPDGLEGKHVTVYYSTEQIVSYISLHHQPHSAKKDITAFIVHERLKA